MPIVLDTQRLPAACLFDLDGLLLDTEPLHGRAWAAAAAHFGGSLSDDELLQLRGRRRQDCAEHVNERLPKPVGTEALLAVQQPIVRQLLVKANAMPAADDLIRLCHREKIPMALVTSSSEESVRFKSGPHPWLGLIEVRIYGDDPELIAGKPDPAPFLLAARRLQVDPHQCWALEDSKAGTAAAQAAGCRVWVLDRSEGCDPVEADPCHISSLDTVLSSLISTAG